LSGIHLRAARTSKRVKKADGLALEITIKITGALFISYAHPSLTKTQNTIYHSSAIMQALWQSLLLNAVHQIYPSIKVSTPYRMMAMMNHLTKPTRHHVTCTVSRVPHSLTNTRE
jgi:hypothetical protein